MTGEKEYSFSIFEKIIYLLILIVSLFCFAYPDIEITSLHGMAFLDAVKAGKILQYYSFAIPYHEVPPLYDIAYYFFWGIWELPLWLTELISGWQVPVWLRVVWCKSLLILLYFTVINLTLKLIAHFTSGHDAKEYKFWMLLSSFAILTIFMMGQYDVIYLVIMLYAFDLLIEKKLSAGAFLLGIAALFKYFPLFVAVPAFLLVEKRKGRLFQYFSISVLPVICGKIIFLFDQTSGLSEIRKAFFKSMFGRFFATEIVLGSGKAALFIVLYILICFWAYASIAGEDDRRNEKILYFPMLVICSLFLCILWHVGWMLILLPFVVMAAAWNPRFKVEIYYASVLLFSGVLLFISGFQYEGWFQYSPIVSFLPKMQALPEEAKYTFLRLFSHYELVPMLCLSVIVSGLILLAVLAWPGWKKMDPPPEKHLFRWELWLGSCIVPVLVLIFISLHLLSVRSEHKLFRPGTSALRFYRPSWQKEKEFFREHVVVNSFRLKQKQFAPPLCLVPRVPLSLKRNVSACPEQYVLLIPQYEGIQARLKAVHLVLDTPFQKSPQIILHDKNGMKIQSELMSGIPDPHLVIPVRSDAAPANIALTVDGKVPVLKEFYLEFDETAGSK